MIQDREQHTEEWRPIPGADPGFEASSHGRVRGPRGIYRTPVGAQGYPKVGVYFAGRRVVGTVHTYVAQAFLPTPSPGANHVNHRDGDKTNNAATNLEWVTPGENVRHAASHGLHPRGERVGSARLDESSVRRIRATYRRGTAGHGVPALAKAFGVDPETIRAVLHRRTWRHVR